MQGEQAGYEKQYVQRLASYQQFAKTYQKDVATANEAIEALQGDHQKRSPEYQQQIQQAKREGYLALYGDALSIVGTFAGQQFSIYKSMFVAEKAYAFASTLIHSQAAIAKAWDSAPFPANLANVAVTIAKTSAIADLISATSISGQAHDGTYYMQGGERVIDRSANQDLTRYLGRANQTNGGNSRGGDFNITAPVTVEAKPGMSHAEAYAQGKARW